MESAIALAIVRAYFLDFSIPKIWILTCARAIMHTHFIDQLIPKFWNCHQACQQNCVPPNWLTCLHDEVVLPNQKKLRNAISSRLYLLAGVDHVRIRCWSLPPDTSKARFARQFAHCHHGQILDGLKRKVDETDDLSVSSEDLTLVTKRNRTTARKTPNKNTPSKKKGRIDGKTVQQHRRALGDLVKNQINVEKWTLEATTCMETKTSLEVVKALVVPNATSVVPADFSAETPVVVASVESSKAIGEIFGHSKIKGGTRLGSWIADKADIVFYPPAGQMRVWWTMSGY